MAAIPHFYCKKSNRFIFQHFMLKISLKRFITEYVILDVTTIEGNTLITTVVDYSFCKKIFVTMT